MWYHDLLAEPTAKTYETMARYAQAMERVDDRFGRYCSKPARQSWRPWQC
jgi:hypothetical protein